jgi:hypothetical protein
MAVSMQWKLLAAAAALSALAFGACGDDKEDPKPSDKSDSGTNNNGSPIDIANLDDGVAGSPCTKNADCKGTNASCAKDPMDTESVAACTGACETDANCGAGGTCIKPITFAGVPGICAKVCSGGSECGADLECREGVDLGSVADMLGSLLGDAGVGDAGGGGGATQNVPKTCQGKLETITLDNGVVGKACTDDAACGEGTCRKNLLATYPGGYCTADCYDSTTCGNTGSCARPGLLAALGAPGSCLLKCTSVSDCRTGYECRESVNFFGPGKFCLPAQPTDAGVPADSGAADASAPVDAGAPADAAASDAGTDATAP